MLHRRVAVGDEAKGREKNLLLVYSVYIHLIVSSYWKQSSPDEDTLPRPHLIDLHPDAQLGQRAQTGRRSLEINLTNWICTKQLNEYLLILKTKNPS